VREALEPAATPFHVAAVAGEPGGGSWLRSALSSAGVAAEVVDLVGAPSAARHAATTPCDAFVAIDSPRLDAAALVSGLRAGGFQGAIVVVGEASAIDREDSVRRAGADAYRSVAVTSATLLAGDLVRAVAARRLASEHRRLSSRERQRLEVDRDDAQRVLDEQRQLVGELEGFATLRVATPSSPVAIDRGTDPLDSLRAHYADLVRDAVSVGGSEVASGLAEIAAALVRFGYGAPTVIEFHLHAVEQLLAGLGGRGARHALARADVVAMDLVVHLAERYRAGYVAEDPSIAAPNRLAA
jgi:hypothetical protein